MHAIEVAYRRASAALLGLFMSQRPDGLDLPGRLRGDWFGQFMDASVEELERNVAEVPLTRLEGLMDLAIRTSSVASDSYRDDISCSTHSFKIEDACKRMSKGQSLPNEEPDEDADGAHGPSKMPPQAAAVAAADGAGITENSGVRCFTLKYRTCWPVSIIFSKALMLKYQVIFRHLLFCRYVERKLVEVWTDHQFTKDLGIDSFSRSFSLRQRMLHFCRDYIYYASVEVLEPQSHRFLASIEQAETIDEVIKSHEKFLNTCLRELLLTERDVLYRHLSKVLNTCLTFAFNLHNALLRFAKPGSSAKGEMRAACLAFVQQGNHATLVHKFRGIFESQMQGFLHQIRQESTNQYEHFLSNMLTRLDYNDFYSTTLERSMSATPPVDS
jgi:gamma-tubulin complex component 2